MPRVHHRKARKDYPASGINKGDMYYTWSIKLQRGGIVKRSLTYPKRSQLTMSDFLGQAYDLDDAVQDAEDVDALRSLADDVRALGEEQREKQSNMPDHLQDTGTGELLGERADQCDEWADSIEAACDEFDQFEPDEDDSAEDQEVARQEAFDNAKGDIDCPI